MKNTYSEMKDSGVEWLGMIPKHWELIANKYVMKKQKTICQHWQGENIMSLTKVGVIIRDINNPFGKMPETFDGYQYVQSGNLLMCLFDIDVTPRCVGRVLNNGVTSPAYSNFKLAENASLDYYYYYYLMLDNEKTLLHLAKNLRHSFTEEHLAQLKVPFPPLPEQTAIAAYLDEKCGAIDEIIAEAKASIEEYKAWKSSVIFEAVTKGLNPNAEMKDSGVEWIGKVPRHWKVCTLKRLCSQITDGSHFSPETVDDGFPYITAGDVSGKGLNYAATKKISTEDFENLQRAGCRPYKGDVLLVKDGATTGRTGLMIDDTPCVALSSVAILRPVATVNSAFLMYMMMSELLQFQIRMSMAGSAMPRTTLSKLVEYKALFCENEEQLDIVKYLDEKCATIDGIIAEKEALIADMEAYKKSLIFETVTGKRKVC